MITDDDEGIRPEAEWPKKLRRSAEWHIRWDGLIEACATTVLLIGFSIILGYLSWVKYLEFYASFQRSIWDSDAIDYVVVNVFLTAFCIAGALITIEGSPIQTSLKKEIKKELKRRKERN